MQAVTSGLLERGPTRSARTFGSGREGVSGYELVVGKATAAWAYLNDVFSRRRTRGDGRGDGGEIAVAAALLSGARKSEKLAAAFEV